MDLINSLALHENLLDLNINVGREDVLKPAIGNDSLHEGFNHNEVKIIHFATQKNVIV